ncbi:YicC/YloC family endoribonuclease [Dethiobacter alkaliphilus]|uniref:YicC/YloC family endoribonuclease n=1 Tax=Dethiobacter alkaliphilus TaxID=427926 RepID=UPI0022275B80|nr:YicC/YloC family endoribonuclease [Dethiobacter alkaliphilus]MCW3490908.1 YicC family protein [Dethiobacter alkaliphilus]
MIRSMTGYGQADSAPEESIRFKVEMRSVNHRYLDVSIRMPREIQSLEDRVRRSLQKRVSRGRVDVFINWKLDTADAVSVTVDRGLVLAYQQALTEMSEVCSLDEKPGLDLLSRFPDVLRVEKEQTDADEIWQQLEPVLLRAIDGLLSQRREEGERLAADFRKRLDAVEETSKQVEKRAPSVVEEYRSKLQDRLNEYLGQAEMDPARVLTEAAVFADRSNVTEELVRLASHLTAFRETLQTEEPVGRKLDFLTQELFREINTIGSKANDYEIASLVVDMKTELEKIREQVQNIE